MSRKIGIKTRQITEVPSALARFREPARRFVRAQNPDEFDDSVLTAAEYQMRCLLFHKNYPDDWPEVTDDLVVRAYDLHLFATLRVLVMSLLVAGNTLEESAAKADLPLDVVGVFAYFFCSEDFIKLTQASKLTVLATPQTLYQHPEFRMAATDGKVATDIHFGLQPTDLKKHVHKMREKVIADQYYLAVKDVHYVKPGQKAFAAVQDALDRSSATLKDFSGGEKSGTIDMVIKKFEDMQAKKVIVEAKDVEELNLPPIEEEKPGEQRE
jgi:hypothetical protein